MNTRAKQAKQESGSERLHSVVHPSTVLLSTILLEKEDD